MSNIIEYSAKEEELKVLSIKKMKAAKKRYYVPNENDDLTKTFNNCLKLCNDADMVEKHNLKFSLHYVYPCIAKTTWAHIFKASPSLKMYSGIDIIIEVSGDVWENIDEKLKNILIEHELMHLNLVENDDGVLKIGLQGHDLEDFVKIIEKYGIEWTQQKELIEEHLEEMEKEKKAKEKELAIKMVLLRREADLVKLHKCRYKE